MTNLADRIYALTGAEDNATLRAIDAEVAALLCGGKLRYPFGQYWRPNDGSYNAGYYLAEHFTTSLDATLEEIRRRGWRTIMGDTLGIANCDILAEVPGTFAHTVVSGARRTDDNLALAAVEALVRAVEAGE